MRSVLWVAWLFAWIFCHSVAFAQERIALLIGNNDYPGDAKLGSPVGDAQLMMQRLTAAGFRISGDGPLTNLPASDFKTAVDKFVAELKGDAVGLFYFAGHGFEEDGEYYLNGVSSKPPRSEDEAKENSIRLNYVVSQMQHFHTGINIVLLDACRKNPWKTRAFTPEPGIRPGLPRRVDGTALKNTIISFAAQPSAYARDGVEHSPYTLALDYAIPLAGKELHQTLAMVSRKVHDQTLGVQDPHIVTSSLRTDFYFHPGRPVAVPADRVTNAPPDPIMIAPSKNAKSRPSLRVPREASLPPVAPPGPRVAPSSPRVAPSSGRCNSVQARCAVEIGGVCNPQTGKWAYGKWEGKEYGGNILAFNTCIGRNYARR